LCHRRFKLLVPVYWAVMISPVIRGSRCHQPHWPLIPPLSVMTRRLWVGLDPRCDSLMTVNKATRSCPFSRRLSALLVITNEIHPTIKWEVSLRMVGSKSLMDPRWMFQVRLVLRTSCALYFGAYLVNLQMNRTIRPSLYSLHIIGGHVFYPNEIAVDVSHAIHFFILFTCGESLGSRLFPVLKSEGFVSQSLIESDFVSCARLVVRSFCQ
jgi:hypothetical protein